MYKLDLLATKYASSFAALLEHARGTAASSRPTTRKERVKLLAPQYGNAGLDHYATTPGYGGIIAASAGQAVAMFEARKL